MTPISEIRGFRNHNPGNIRHGDRWKGLSKGQPDPAFCTFVSPEYGIRAMGRSLLNYRRRHKLTTLRGIIELVALGSVGGAPQGGKPWTGCPLCG